MTITLPIGVAYTIAETPEYGYTTTWKQGEGEAQEGVTAAITLMEDATIEFTNDRPAVSPTDVRLNLAPFALMLAAGLMLLLIARRRRQGAKD